MEKLNRKRVCMIDYRVILGASYWTFTSSRIREEVKFHLFAKTLNVLGTTQGFLWLCIVETTKLLN